MNHAKTGPEKYIENERRRQFAKLLKQSSPAKRRSIQRERKIGQELQRELEALING